MTRKEELTAKFEFAIEHTDINFVAILLKMPAQTKPEIIVNFRESIPNKLEYYKSAYDDNLVLKTNPLIKIIDFIYAYTWDEIFEFFTL